MDDICYETVPEGYAGYDPIVVTVSAKASYLAVRRPQVDSILMEAVRKVRELEVGPGSCRSDT